MKQEKLGVIASMTVVITSKPCIKVPTQIDAKFESFEVMVTVIEKNFENNAMSPP